jgi:hypothetical protein
VITVATDHIERRPQIDHRVEEIVRTDGTSIRIAVDSASSYLPSVDGRRKNQSPGSFPAADDYDDLSAGSKGE